ncbi:MAG: hypothetical protein J6113_09285 [Lachnospiraceae bacterium]|nr:hypothetical protein [Lachnospiraceae bacterium]
MKAFKNRFAFVAIAFAALLLAFLPAVSAKAGDYDKIELYEMDITVNDDATLDINYHIKWKLLEPLENTSEFKVFWVTIGVPNNHCTVISASDNVESAKLQTSGGVVVRVNFFKRYDAGEVVDFSFKIRQDYMYSVIDEEARYEFTPGWFKDIKIAKMIIRWDDTAGKMKSATPAFANEDGFLTWEFENLGHNARKTVSVTYDATAYGFDTTKYIVTEKGGSSEDDGIDGAAVIGGLIFFGFWAFVIFGVIISAIEKYSSTANLGTTKKITRTKVEYYPTCPGCGAARPEGKNNCEYCGRSFIKSEETIEEKDIPKEETELKGKATSGLYRYHSSPNTYLRVNVVNIPAPRSTTRSSCAHSSCACASHCACACACACAGGGRAGCSTKDFYNTNLKLKFFEKMKK